MLRLVTCIGKERDKAEIGWLRWDYTGSTLLDGELEPEIGEPILPTLQRVEGALTTVAAAQRRVFVQKVLAKLGRDRGFCCSPLEQWELSSGLSGSRGGSVATRSSCVRPGAAPWGRDRSLTEGPLLVAKECRGLDHCLVGT